jgi:peptide deformylase
VSLVDWTELDLGVTGEILPVVYAPNPVLAGQAEPVDPTDPKVVQLAADLIATMRVSPGCVGLAAPQVDVGQRVFCVDVSTHPRARTKHGTFAFCNAEIVQATRRESGREGCLSVPDLTGDVRRATRLVVAGMLPGSAESVTIETDAFEARAVQHEIDHCAGLLFLDRVAGAHAVYPRRRYL